VLDYLNVEYQKKDLVFAFCAPKTRQKPASQHRRQHFRLSSFFQTASQKVIDAEYPTQSIRREA